VEGDWRAAVWVDDRRVLLCRYDRPVLELLDTDGNSLATVGLPAFALDLAVDRNGRRAMAVLRDRLVIVRIAPERSAPKSAGR
jgi:hypothetical protein